MPKYQLGQRVKYVAYMRREKTYREGKWVRCTYPGEGVVVGIRTVSDGYTDYSIMDGGMEEALGYHPTKFHSFYLIAHNLAGYRHVAEEDMEPCENQST